jgi:hypothetical protein
MTPRLSVFFQNSVSKEQGDDEAPHVEAILDEATLKGTTSRQTLLESKSRLNCA